MKLSNRKAKRDLNITRSSCTSFKVRVIKDSSDASKDYWLPYAEAKAKYEAGELGLDLTNNCYTEEN